MKKIKIIFLMFGMLAFMTSCSLTLPVSATGNKVGSKVGTAKASGYFGMIYMNADASIQAAAKNGGITKISTVDLKQTSMFNILTTYECIVTGE
tara:strand:- start:617 stop:898 length:282 start_codon:yes stop_codon:yes gene_type:complete